MSPLLFQASNRRLADLEKIYTDELVSKVPWKTFIEGMMRDWEQFVINVNLLKSLVFATCTNYSEYRQYDNWLITGSTTQDETY